MASTLYKLWGTVVTTFQLGIGGPKLKNNGGVVECKNAADLVLVPLRAGDPVGLTDVVTKQWGLLNLAGGVGAAATVVEIDFGSTPVKGKKFTIVDASVIATTNVIASQSGLAATGRQADENEMDALICRVTPGTGQFTLYVEAYPGPVSGKYKIQYMLK
jgi:hypothetical protein